MGAGKEGEVAGEERQVAEGRRKGAWERKCCPLARVGVGGKCVGV